MFKPRLLVFIGYHPEYKEHQIHPHTEVKNFISCKLVSRAIISDRLDSLKYQNRLDLIETIKERIKT